MSHSDDVHPQSRQEKFWAIVKAQTVGKAASHARQGLVQEGILINTNYCFPSSGGLVEAQDSQIDYGCLYRANFPSKDILPNSENMSMGKLSSIGGRNEHSSQIQNSK